MALLWCLLKFDNPHEHPRCRHLPVMLSPPPSPSSSDHTSIGYRFTHAPHTTHSPPYDLHATRRSRKSTLVDDVSQQRAVLVPSMKGRLPLPLSRGSTGQRRLTTIVCHNSHPLLLPSHPTKDTLPPSLLRGSTCRRRLATTSRTVHPHKRKVTP